MKNGNRKSEIENRDEGAPPIPVGPRLVESILLPIGTAAVVIAFWHAAVRLSHTNVFPSPLAVLRGRAWAQDIGQQARQKDLA